MDNKEKSVYTLCVQKLYTRCLGQVVKTLASHAEIRGSIPLGTTNKTERVWTQSIPVLFCFVMSGWGGDRTDHARPPRHYQKKRHGFSPCLFVLFQFIQTVQPLNIAHVDDHQRDCHKNPAERLC